MSTETGEAMLKYQITPIAIIAMLALGATFLPVLAAANNSNNSATTVAERPRPVPPSKPVSDAA